MGFRILEDTIKSSLFITKENMDLAFPILKSNLLNRKIDIKIDYDLQIISKNLIVLDRELLIDTDLLFHSNNFEDLINAFKWQIIFDDNGNCIQLFNDGLNIADEHLLFTCLEEYIEDGSFIEYQKQSYLGNVKERYDYQNKTSLNKTFIEDYDQNNKSYWRQLA